MGLLVPPRLLNPGIHIRQIPCPEKPTWDPIRIEGDPRATCALARRTEFFNPVIPTPISAQSRWFFSASRNPCILSFQNLALFWFKIPDNIQYPVKPLGILIINCQSDVQLARRKLLLFKPTNPIRQVTVATAKELIYGGTLSLLRGTQRLFSVKYLFGEANIAYNFLLIEDG